jgi:cardiolipin synthase (CMP-forming)
MKIPTKFNVFHPKYYSLKSNLNLPNTITLSRMITTPFIGYFISNNQIGLGLSLLGVAAFSDALDGYIARKYHMKTPLGTILDPLADKLLMTTLVVSLTNINLLPLELGVTIIARDILLVGNTIVQRYKTLPRPVLCN